MYVNDIVVLANVEAYEFYQGQKTRTFVLGLDLKKWKHLLPL